MVIYFDTHAHLDQDDFDRDRAAMIDRARAAGVTTIVAVGVTVESSRAVIRLAAENPGVYAAVGIHPNYCHQASADDWRQIELLAGSPRVVALGETGLDRYRDHAPFTLQQEYFDRHIRLSQQTGLPFIVHSRQADDDVLTMIRAAAQRGPVRGVMHSFTSTAETAALCLELGMYISFAGMVTFKKSQELREVAATIPTDRILIETDSPYLAPQPMRGKRNEPANVIHTADCLAEVRGLTPAEFAAQTTANAQRLFSRVGE